MKDAIEMIAVIHRLQILRTIWRGSNTEQMSVFLGYVADIIATRINRKKQYTRDASLYDPMHFISELENAVKSFEKGIDRYTGDELNGELARRDADFYASIRSSFPEIAEKAIPDSRGKEKVLIYMQKLNYGSCH